MANHEKAVTVATLSAFVGLMGGYVLGFVSQPEPGLSESDRNQLINDIAYEVSLEIPEVGVLNCARPEAPTVTTQVEDLSLAGDGRLSTPTTTTAAETVPPTSVLPNCEPVLGLPRFQTPPGADQ